MINRLEWTLKWSANIVVMAAAIATSFDFVSVNKYLFLLGSILWMLVGFVWQQPSLWSMNLLISVIYILGFFF